MGNEYGHARPEAGAISWLGGSRSVTVPKDFLEPHQVDEQNAEWILTNEGILLTRKPSARRPIEEEPEFAKFLSFLEQSAARHAEDLGNILDLTDPYLDLVEGVDLDK